MILALDIGGTAVKLGLVERDGTIRRKTSADVAFDNYRTPVFTTVVSAARRFLEEEYQEYLKDLEGYRGRPDTDMIFSGEPSYDPETGELLPF